jgi:hypothetical protein
MWTRGTIILGVAAALLSGPGAVSGAMRGTYDRYDVQDVFAAVLLVCLSIGGWLVAMPRLDRRADFLTLCAMVVVFAGLFAWSQLRPGVIAPPIDEWGIACGLVGSGFVGVALGRRVRVRGADPSWRRLGWRGSLGLAATGWMVACMCCIPFAKDISDEPLDYDMPGALLDSEAHDYEMRPLPPRTNLVEQSCSGMHSKCYADYTFVATDGAMGGELVDRLVTHYRSLGWPLTLNDSKDFRAYQGCRRVAGILSWRDHCMMIFVDAIPYVGVTNDPNAVNVFIQ